MTNIFALSLLSIQSNNSAALALLRSLSEDELATRQLTKEHQKEYGVRSPKLSKALVSLGMDGDSVALALSSMGKKTSSVTWVSLDPYDAWEQGDTDHYASCQYSGSGYDQRHEEVPTYGDTWFMWVVGQRKTVDGEGFKARAKLRLLFNAAGEVAGLYVDRPYGQFNLLLNNVTELEAWWLDYCQGVKLPILVAPVWQRENGAGNHFQYTYGKVGAAPYYCPSACQGYQDTLSGCSSGPFTFMVPFGMAGMTLKRVYTYRDKVGSHATPGTGVYMQPLGEVKYNPQNLSLDCPGLVLPVDRLAAEDGGRLNRVYRAAKLLFNVDLKPNRRRVGYKQGKYSLYNGTLYRETPDGGEQVAVYSHDRYDNYTRLEVVEDAPDLALYAPVFVHNPLHVLGLEHIEGLRVSNIPDRLFGVSSFYTLRLGRDQALYYPALPHLGRHRPYVRISRGDTLRRLIPEDCLYTDDEVYRMVRRDSFREYE